MEHCQHSLADRIPDDVKFDVQTFTYCCIFQVVTIRTPDLAINDCCTLKATQQNLMLSAACNIITQDKTTFPLRATFFHTDELQPRFSVRSKPLPNVLKLRT